MLTFEKRIQKLFIDHQWTLGLAESYTGGGLSLRLASVPDCSLYYMGSIVAYANSAKCHLLQVQEKTLKMYGAVSEETAKEMALGALQQLDCEIALSTTGIAGPSGGSIEKPVGTTYVGIASKKREAISFRLNFKGDRREIIDQSMEVLLRHLWEYALQYSQ